MKKNKIFNAFFDYYRRLDKVLCLIILFISCFSLLLLKSVSRATVADYFEIQLLAIALGVFAALFLTFIDYATISNFWYLIAGVGVFLMIYTIFFGINLSGDGGVNATAWINIAGKTFQPSELVKIGFIITYAKHLDSLKKSEKLKEFKQIVFLVAHALVPILLCHKQGDDGASVIFFFMFVFMSFAAGIELKYFIILAVVLVIAIPILWNFVLSEYQIARFTAIFNLDDPKVALDEGYQQYQGRISIGSGGFFGKGLFNGSRVQAGSVIYQQSDFIFSVAGEETGFFGCFILIISLAVLMLRVLFIASKSRDYMGKIMCFGYFAIIFTQSVANIGMCLALLPVMGVTLPFYSAGGSSVVCLFIGLGLVQNIYMRREFVDGIRLRKKYTNSLSYSDFKKFEN